MKDETYAFISDVKEKKVTARSARHMRTHCGKGGRVRLPSDNLSKKELMKMSGECKSYRLNAPMKWAEFKTMPDDIKVTYIKLIREKFGCPDSKIGEMMGASKDQISLMFKKLGLNHGKTKKKTNWDKEGFYAWANGVDKLPTPVPEEIPVVEPIQEEQEVFVEDDLPFEEPEPFMDEKILTGIYPSQAELLKAELEKAKEENIWLRKELKSDQMQIRILQAQMDVVRMIFGGQNRG